MRRPLVALVLAVLSVLGAEAASSGAHEVRATGTPVFNELTAVARLAVAAVPAPQSSVPPLSGLAVLLAAAAIDAAALGYAARRCRRAVFLPILTSPVRLRGPPGSRVPD
jgi:hypothetical protein